MRDDRTPLLTALPSAALRSLIGVSGGRDSVVLLHWLHELGFRRLIVCHVNHGLRGRASGQDAMFVKRLANGLGYQFEGLKADVTKLAKERRQSVETVAREVRLAFFAEMARKHRCPRVFLAHHADDQAETVLMRVLRGTGISGLAGMAPETSMRVGKTKLVLLRPMLGVRRSDIDAFVKANGIAFREDSTNAESQATRNRLRNNLLPRLSAELGQDVAPMLVRLAKIAKRDDDLLSSLSESLAEKVIHPDGSLVLSPEFKEAHEALLHRVIFAWLQGRNVSDLKNEVIEAAVKLLIQHEPARVNLPGDLQIRRKAGRLTIGRQ